MRMLVTLLPDWKEPSKLLKVRVECPWKHCYMDRCKKACCLTIMGSELFKKVACLKKKNCKKPDKIPKTYSRETFTLDGQMELDIFFGGNTMRTNIYIKLCL